MEKHKSSKSSELGIPDREKRKPFKVFSDGNLNCKKFKVFPFAQQLKCPVIVFFAGHIKCPALRDISCVPRYRETLQVSRIAGGGGARNSNDELVI